MAICLDTDLAKSRRGSQPEGSGRALLGRTSRLRRVRPTGLQARQRMKTSIFRLCTRLKHQKSGLKVSGGGLDAPVLVGLKKNTSASRSGQGRHRGVGSESGSGSLCHSKCES